MPKNLTVLQILPALVAGGVERGTVEIAAAIVAAGGRALVASAGGPLVAEVIAAGGEHTTLPMGAKAPWAIASNAAALARIIREKGVGIVHARSRAPAWAGFFAARRTGAHFVTTYHGAYNEGFLGKRLYNSVMARGERVIAISGFIRDLIIARHDIDPQRICLIPRGVDTIAFDPAAVTPARAAAFRAKVGLDAATPMILLPARLTRWKGQVVAVRALAALPGPAVLVLAGGDAAGTFANELRALAGSFGIADRLRFAGHVTDLPAALSTADLVLHTSTDPEAFGRTVIEAQAMARVIIASDLGAPRETVAEGITGFRSPPGDPAALSAAMARVLAMTPEIRAEIGARARAAVLRDYTREAMQAATLAVYRDLS
ncbi:glycosyltransferase family 4 protein [Humitalea sp. 24SJ18S-53]|uniref:glycosyltransferase family 4 protein n=1 Tax=Humitalea sp. 24SJ18S-53 TaxID=3422307 RepID=UPI003D665934